MKRQAILVLLVLCAITLVSCGQSGKLYLPEKQKAEEAKT
jgi:predicted small lipoprotein YifL